MEPVRNVIIAARKALFDMSFQDAAICGMLMPFIGEETSSVFGFCATKGEPNLSSMYVNCGVKGISVAYPICQKDNSLIFKVPQKKSDFVLGRFGIVVPKNSCKIQNADKNAICFVPGLCFDTAGNRMGHGKGYYDRFLADFPGIKIGVCYGSFVVNHLETNPHDISMDLVVCETGIIYKREGWCGF